jgi:hypothetical protein
MDRPDRQARKIKSNTACEVQTSFLIRCPPRGKNAIITLPTVKARQTVADSVVLACKHHTFKGFRTVLA